MYSDPSQIPGLDAESAEASSGVSGGKGRNYIAEFEGDDPII
jgi:hypothetical protein